MNVRLPHREDSVGTRVPWRESSLARIAGGEARWRVPGPGSFLVSVGLEIDGTRTGLFHSGEATSIHVTFPFSSEPIHVPVTGERIARARATLREFLSRDGK